jgi:glutamyl-Q tRNA(Asp) synthetase
MSNSINPVSQIRKPDSGYVGRFAPSPTGPLHFGSVIAAVASYIDARANQGRWLVRMEDLDPPREPPGAAANILRQLTQLGLQWDGEVLYQSQRLEYYALALQELIDNDLCFRCDCSRSKIKSSGSIYDGACRHRPSEPEQGYAVRIKTEDTLIEFQDLVQGVHRQNLGTEVGDFVILRKDKLFAYQLAVVVDDEYQGITHVVRGFDLLDSTPRQVYLQQLLNYSTPRYGHIPVIVNASGDKLSKQSFAPSADVENSSHLIYQCLILLGQAPPGNLLNSDPHTQLRWGIAHWDVQAVPKLAKLPQELSK